MTYRGIVAQGVIVVTDGSSLPEGQVVDVTLVPAAECPAEPEDLPGFGLWKDRTDIGDTAEFAARLRRSMEERRT